MQLIANFHLSWVDISFETTITFENSNGGHIHIFAKVLGLNDTDKYYHFLWYFQCFVISFFFQKDCGVIFWECSMD